MINDDNNNNIYNNHNQIDRQDIGFWLASNPD